MFSTPLYISQQAKEFICQDAGKASI